MNEQPAHRLAAVRLLAALFAVFAPVLWAELLPGQSERLMIYNTVEYSGTTQFRSQAACVMDVTAAAVPGQPDQVKYALAGRNGIWLAGSGNWSQALRLNDVTLVRDRKTELLVDGTKGTELWQQVSNTCIQSVTRVTKDNIGETWRQSFRFPFFPPAFPQEITFEVSASAQSVDKLGQMVLVTAASEPFEFLALGDGDATARATCTLRFACLFDADVEDVYFSASVFEAKTAVNGHPEQLRRETVTYRAGEDGRPVELRGVDDTFTTAVHGLGFSAEPLAVKQDGVLPPWAVFAMLTADTAELSAGIACEGAPNFVQFVVLGPILMADTMVSAISWNLTVWGKVAGVRIPQYEGLIHHALQGYAHTWADVKDVDDKTRQRWVATAGVLGDFADLAVGVSGAVETAAELSLKYFAKAPKPVIQVVDELLVPVIKGLKLDYAIADLYFDHYRKRPGDQPGTAALVGRPPTDVELTRFVLDLGARAIAQAPSSSSKKIRIPLDPAAWERAAADRAGTGAPGATTGGMQEKRNAGLRSLRRRRIQHSLAQREAIMQELVEEGKCRTCRKLGLECMWRREVRNLQKNVAYGAADRFNLWDQRNVDWHTGQVQNPWSDVGCFPQDAAQMPPSNGRFCEPAASNGHWHTCECEAGERDQEQAEDELAGQADEAYIRAQLAANDQRAQDLEDFEGKFRAALAEIAGIREQRRRAELAAAQERERERQQAAARQAAQQPTLADWNQFYQNWQNMQPQPSVSGRRSRGGYNRGGGRGVCSRCPQLRAQIQQLQSRIQQSSGATGRVSAQQGMISQYQQAIQRCRQQLTSCPVCHR